MILLITRQIDQLHYICHISTFLLVLFYKHEKKTHQNSYCLCSQTGNVFGGKCFVYKVSAVHNEEKGKIAVNILTFYFVQK